MKRLLLLTVACGLAAAAVAVSSFQPVTFEPEVKVEVEDRNPWTHLRVNNDPKNFQFVIVTDRTGGHRPRIFSQAVKQINLLQPEFVLSVGDLIEGYTEDDKRLNAEWEEFQGYVRELEMPFFYVPGNHDYMTKAMLKQWGDRFGRSYYHFVYRGVMFLVLNTEDPPGRDGNISPEQIAYARQALQENGGARWTIVAMHKPLWSYPDVETNGWLEVEKALGSRPYTVFAGHRHKYFKFHRNGRDYYQLATTGGGSNLRGAEYGEFDHVVWVTMKDGGPVLANIMLDGIYPEDLKIPVTDEKGSLPKKEQQTYPVTGRVLYNGQSAHNAQVVFYLADKEKKKLRATATGLVEEDGLFRLTTYEAFDGAPAGQYAVTVTWRDPFYEPTGGVNRNKLPERYAEAATSGLRAEVTAAGPNDFTFELRE